MKSAKETQFKARLTFPVNQLINSEFRKHGKREVVKTKWQPNIAHKCYIESVLDSFPLSIIVKLSLIIEPLFQTIMKDT